MLSVQSGDSAKASSALQALDTIIPDHDPGLAALFCPASAKGTVEKRASIMVKEHFQVKSALTDRHNFRLSFRSYSLVVYTGSSERTTTTPQSNPGKPLTSCRSYCTYQTRYLTAGFSAIAIKPIE